nr:MAG TPA: hypothetical protein [Caudoviricetes sp.]
MPSPRPPFLPYVTQNPTSPRPAPYDAGPFFSCSPRMIAMPWATPRIRSCSVTSKSLIYSEIKAPISSAGSLMLSSTKRSTPLRVAISYLLDI